MTEMQHEIARRIDVRQPPRPGGQPAADRLAGALLMAARAVRGGHRFERFQAARIGAVA